MSDLADATTTRMTPDDTLKTTQELAESLVPGWARGTVQEIAARTPNAVVGGPFGSDLVSSDYVEEGVPVIRGQNMGGKTVSGEFVFVTDAKANSLQANVAHPGDIVFTQRGTLGQVSMVPDFPYPRYLVSQSQMKLTPDPRKADPAFIYYMFSGPELQAHISESTIQTGVPHINLGILRNTPLSLPPLPEQRAIAEALSDVDSLITALNTLIAKKRDIKLATMQQLLSGRTRLQGFESEWETQRIGSFAECVAGGTPNTLVPHYWDGEIRWMTSGELHGKRIREVAGRVTPDGLAHSNARMLPRDCVLVGLAGQGKTRGTVALNEVPLSTNQSIAAILPAACYESEYLFYNLESRYEELRELSAGDGGRGGLNLAILRSVEVPFPLIAEQKAIASVLSDMDAEIEALEARVAKTRDIKQGMMQQLLTGRIRLPVPATEEPPHEYRRPA